MIAGRVEAKLVVPAGGAGYSASCGAMSSAYAGTIQAGAYYLTAAGGVSSLLGTLQQQLNDNVQGYPQTADAIRAAVGYGTWSAGWLCNEAAGSLAPAFGSVNLAPVNTPLYGLAGARGGVDKAVGFDAFNDQFAGNNSFNITGTEDLCLAWVGKFTGLPSAADIMFVKGNAGAARWTVYATASIIAFEVVTGSGNVTSFVPLTDFVGLWHAGMATVDRSTGLIRIAVRSLDGTVVGTGNPLPAAALTSANVDNFTLGGRGGNEGATSWLCAAAYIGTGAGAATGLATNIAAALESFANAINASWSVAMSTTSGRIAIANSFWPSYVQFASAELRNLLGFESGFDYPQTAAQIAAALGYGAWANGAGYLFNEASGNPGSAFGAPAVLTVASGALTYSNQGARGGVDKAIGFAAGTQLSGGSSFEANDLILLWVGLTTASPPANRGWFHRYNGASGSYYVFRRSDSLVQFNLTGSGGDIGVTVTDIQGEPHVGVACVDRSTSKARIALRGLISGVTQLSAEIDVSLIATSNGSVFRIGDDVSGGVDTNLKLSAFYAVSGAGVATGLSANLATALANFAAYMKGQTGTKHARGLWLPECSITMEGDPERAPTVSDARHSVSPTGVVLTLVGNTFRRHRSVAWSHVPSYRTWEAEAPFANGSWETFVRETQLGLGSSWFKPGSEIQIYDHNGVQVGADASVAGWSILGLDSVEPRKSLEGYTGLWRIEIPQLVAVGA